MTALIHLALTGDGTVVAQFINTADCAEFCRARGLCHLPFNPGNRHGTPVPVTGSRYSV